MRYRLALAPNTAKPTNEVRAVRDPSTTQAQPIRQTRPNEQLLLGRYRVMSSCGTGGFGTVLTCWDTRLQRRVAIKRMPLAIRGVYSGGAATMSEALAEARTSSMLAHPNIVTMFDFENDHDYAYLVMEYVDGMTLTELLSRVEGGTLTADECAYMVRSLCDALAFAHENGVLHLDIKPSNIMFDRSGAVKLCDFGMATLASATGYGDARGGTIGYMPPEQIEGGLVDERSDVFALAVVAWYALTGDNPFAAGTAEESLAKIERGARRKPSKANPSLAGMAEEVLLQSVSASPSGRLPSVDAFSNELVFGLGDADEGASSIRGLLEQTTDDEGDGMAERDLRALPVAYRYPWLSGCVARMGAAAGSVLVAYQALPFALGDGPQTTLMGCALVAACAAAWTPLGSILAMAACVCALANGAQDATEVLLPTALGAATLAWWIAIGRSERLAATALLAPAVLVCPGAGAGLAAMALTPLRAAFTSVLAYLFALLFRACLASGFAAGPVAQDLLGQLVTTGTWVAIAGVAAAAGAAGAIDRWRGTVASGIAGQILGLVVLVAAQVVAVRVENGGIWAAPKWSAVAIEVLLTVLLCLATHLRGPRGEGEEVEDIHELA
ncbi:serine/threonine-protein kinase [Olsenella uli]|uniref:serine/threonine-protein kinase n=1 Tax=Olsenella uli TaxID=133926 RepID=UPI00071453EB|nr:serine/threonine-protein kinase [Olsenella uli]KRO12324.1 serine threonine protein kinase [Olsenella uli DSM 7084]